MPTRRKYSSDAERARAYRQRVKAQRETELQAKGLPALPALPTMPGTARWKALIERARLELQTAREEMELYHDERTEAWQESDRGEELREWIEWLKTATRSVDEALGF